MDKGWVGVDLNGTLAVYHGWRGIRATGPPIASVVEHVQLLLRKGVTVQLFTARAASDSEYAGYVNEWMQEHLGAILPITDRKDKNLLYTLDDKAVVVKKNTGVFLTQVPKLEKAFDGRWYRV